MHYLKRTLLLILCAAAALLPAQTPQVNIPRVELMPNEPAPYNVRDWRQVALRYDSFVYDVSKTGQYLPLVNLVPAGLNYPQNPFFHLRTYVGTNSPNNSEAINVLPSLVGATLNGIDKTDQFGQNWVLMSQDFFNKNNGELIYLNNPGSGSGSDWWYDLMPNVFFYQLYDLYPNLNAEADVQFVTIANRFLEAVQAMGGKAAPWQKANMDYRAWNFKTMQPNANGVHEPEAAGAFAWVLYNAWKQTGDPAYLQGAEWSIEFLNEWNSNPSYELQLPYGTCIAAKMNAELGTAYDIEKMLNWSFDRGPLRGWGTIVGTWGSFDVDGLVGEANDNGNDYAFQLNGVQQAAMLAPMVRYDKRFARAIGKWMLNLSNATRLFYPGFLPGSLQDASANWSNTYDPERVIGFEALRENYQGNSPYSTGDALNGGWAGTNLALYGTSSIGYLGAIVEKTNVPKILKIDLLKTDFFKENAYPSYLFYNPYAVSKTVDIAVGNSPVDIYEAISETFLLQNASGTVTVTIPADAAILVTLTPAGGDISYDRNKMLVNGTVVDFNQSAQAFSYAPRLKGFAAAKPEVQFGDSTAVYATVFDQDSGSFTWNLSATGGSLSGNGATVQWVAPAVPGDYELTVIVTDDSGQADTATLTLKAVAEINQAPVLGAVQKSAPYVAPGGTLELSIPAADPNGDPLSFSWNASGGAFTGAGASLSWTAPVAEGIYQIDVSVTDDEGLSAQATTKILVKNFVPDAGGQLIAWYPFLGNADDISGHQLHGTASGGPLYVPDFWDHPASACRFDGSNDKVTVANSPLLNFQDAITVSCWFKPLALPQKETFLLSHGSWQNRWKISVTPERKIRWTVNTLTTIVDLDSEVSVELDSAYHLAVSYDGSLLALYLNGQLHSYRPLSGLIRTTTLAFLMGQMLPDNSDYNFKGILDEVKIFDHALTPDAVQSLYNEGISAATAPAQGTQKLLLSPNPAAESLTIELPGGAGLLSVFDAQGKLVFSQKTGAAGWMRLDSSRWPPGIYQVIFRNDQDAWASRVVKM